MGRGGGGGCREVNGNEAIFGNSVIPEEYSIF